MQQPSINVNVTPEDRLQCECGSVEFISVTELARVKPPIIGADPMVIGLKQNFICFKCNLDISHAFTDREGKKSHE